jgi:hypothetical protein
MEARAIVEQIDRELAELTEETGEDPVQSTV